MKCYNCGNDIPGESVFCGMCGARLVPEPKPVAESESTPSEPVTEPKTTNAEPVIDPLTEPVEPITESDPIVDPLTEPVEPVIEPSEPIADPIEPVIESVSEPDEPLTEPVEQPSDTYEPITEPVTDGSGSVQTEHFVINHCPYCGAVLMSGAKFCSNCGNSIAVYEMNIHGRRGTRISAKAVIAAIIAVVVIIWGVSFLADCHSIEGEWAVENSGGGFFDMFSESYLDFDDGTAIYYNGFFNARRYSYTYNRFTKVLTLQATISGGTEPESSILHVEWIDPYTITIRELNMTLYRIEDIPYSYDDDEFDDNDAMMF